MYEFFTKVIDLEEEKLIAACIGGDLQLVKELVRSGINANAVDEYGDTALSQAAFKGHEKIVDFLLTNIAVSIHSKNRALILACQAGHQKIVDQLLQNGADVNVYLEDYHTPLFQVITQNKPDVFARLLEEESLDVNMEDEKGVRPLLLAAF